MILTQTNKASFLKYLQQSDNGVYQISKFEYNDSLPERCYQVALANLISAKIESSVDTGRIDIETTDCVIEVKTSRGIKEAIGQVLVYATETGKHPCIAFFGQLDSVYIKICLDLSITLIDVSRFYSKNIAKKKQTTVPHNFCFQCDYSDIHVLTKQLISNDVLAMNYVRQNSNSVLQKYLQNQDHYMFIRCWELITGLSIHERINPKKYSFLYIEKKLSISNNLVQDFFFLLLTAYMQCGIKPFDAIKKLKSHKDFNN